jgi:hypothetical protein
MSVGVSEGKLGAIYLLIDTFWVIVDVYNQFLVDYICLEKKFVRKSLFGRALICLRM